MKHSDQLTPKERALIAGRAAGGMAQIVEILKKEHDVCPKCAIGLLMAALEYIIDQQDEADHSTIN
jgi:hypothetical protein